MDAVNASHSCSVTLPQLRTCQRQLSAYWARFSARLAPRNARHLQLLMRIVAALMAALGQQRGAAKEQGALDGELFWGRGRSRKGGASDAARDYE